MVTDTAPGPNPRASSSASAAPITGVPWSGVKSPKKITFTGSPGPGFGAASSPAVNQL